MNLIHTLALVMLLVLAVICDLRTRRIPNALTVTGLLTALALGALAGWQPFLAGLAGAGVALALSLPLVMLGGLGGGDAKLLAAVGAYLGPADLLTALLITALVGGAMALALAVHRGQLRQTLAHVGGLLARLGRPTGGDPQPAPRTIRTAGALTIPYGVAIGVGALVTAMGWLP